MFEGDLCITSNQIWHRQRKDCSVVPTEAVGGVQLHGGADIHTTIPWLLIQKSRCLLLKGWADKWKHCWSAHWAFWNFFTQQAHTTPQSRSSLHDFSLRTISNALAGKVWGAFHLCDTLSKGGPAQKRDWNTQTQTASERNNKMVDAKLWSLKSGCLWETVALLLVLVGGWDCQATKTLAMWSGNAEIVWGALVRLEASGTGENRVALQGRKKQQQQLYWEGSKRLLNYPRDMDVDDCDNWEKAKLNREDNKSS